MARWWPFVGLTGLVVVGLAVGRHSTPVDDWFTGAGEAHPQLRRLLIFSDPRVLFAIWAVALVAALLRRRRRLGVVIALAPVAAVLTERLAKHAFGRLRDNALAYPSGHTTLTVVVLGVAVLTAGMATWAVVAATAVTVLAALGQAVTYHYFTDTVGAFFLGTALLATAGWALQLDRCQPDCDVRHSSG